MSVATRVAPSKEFVGKMDTANTTMDQLDITGLDWRLEIIPLEDTYIDQAYQRPADQNWLKKRDGDFKPWLLGTITVSERHNKAGVRFAIVDGQHRSILADTEGLTHLPAVVFYNLTQSDEASLFSAFQQERRNITPFQRFTADLAAGEPRAKAILKVVTEEGFVLSEKVAPQNIKAVARIEKVYDKDPALLRVVLRMIASSWYDLPYNCNERVIGGLEQFLIATPDFDESRFIDRLSAVTPMVLLDRAMKLREGRGVSGGLVTFMKEAIENAYRSSKRR